MSEIKIAVVSVIFAILLIGFTVLVMNFIYPEWETEVDTTNMDKEQIENLERWFE